MNIRMTRRRLNSNALPEELLIEILVKLPFKSLVRLSCVCKTWHALIRSPYFSKRHLTLHKNAEGMLYGSMIWSHNDWRKNINTGIWTYKKDLLLITPHHQNVADSSYSLRVELPYAKKKVVSLHIRGGSCNGILCLADETRIRRSICLFNPITRESFKLPVAKCLSKEDWLAFGFDTLTQDYKVIRIVKQPSSEFVAEMFKLSTNRWSFIQNDDDDDDGGFDLNFIIRIGVGAHSFNGSAHWWVETRIPGEDEQAHILTFDFEAEVFRKIESPLRKQFLHSTILTTLDDRLAFVISKRSYPDDVQKFGVWVVKEYGNKDSWTKKRCVRLIPRHSLSVPYEWRFLTCWNRDEFLLYHFFHGDLISCRLPDNDSEEEEGQQIRTFNIVSNRANFGVNVVSFQPSFASIRMVDEQ